MGSVYTQEDSLCSQSGYLTSNDESFCLQVKIQCTQGNTKVPTPHHVITNLSYRLKPQKGSIPESQIRYMCWCNHYACVCLQVSVPGSWSKKLAPSKLEIGIYTTNTVKLIGSCMFYMVHPDTKHLLEVTFYVASNNGSVLLSCATTLALGLIQPHTRLDYLPPRASLITSSADCCIVK